MVVGLKSLGLMDSAVDGQDAASRFGDKPGGIHSFQHHRAIISSLEHVSQVAEGHIPTPTRPLTSTSTSAGRQAAAANL